ncbi:MAG: glycosyltransferase family 61 protein [Cytophagales bacterium]|nr:glycosyltransferase family 61 protein [Cytophagales bacterium]MDW8384755.1 glycosyltransferase family 61 protein [Flammeovirgaceae bacterium]
MQKITIPSKLPLNHSLTNFIYDPSIDIYTIDTQLYENVYLTPSGVAFKNLKMLPNTYPLMDWTIKEFRKIMLVNFFFRLRHYLPKNRQYLLAYNIWTVGNSPSAGYYHWIAETLPRIFANFEKLSTLTLLLPERAQKVPFVQETLPHLPFEEIVYIPEKKLSIVPKLWVTSYLQGFGFFEPSLLHRVRNFLWEKSNIDSYAHPKIYVSRSRARARRIVNEQTIIPILKELGFDIFHFEDLRLFEQIALMKQATHFVTLHGAALTNALFMKEHQSVMELMREIKEPYLLYMGYCSILNLKYYVQFCSATNPNDIFDIADVTVDPQEFRKNLELICSQ